MKNYIDEARRYKVELYGGYKYLQSYRINKESKYVELRYMNGLRDIKELSDITKEELDKRQRSDLKCIEDDVKEKTAFDIKYNGFISALYVFVGVFLKGLANAGCYVWLTWAGYFLAKSLRPLRLRKDIQLAGWIYDNRDKVNEVIHDEVIEKAPNLEITAMTNNAPLQKYPYGEVPYSKEMYDYGIDLNNIDELSNKQLRSLKRKVLKRERRK